MKRVLFFSIFVWIHISAFAQQDHFSPEMLWQLHRLSPMGLSQDSSQIVYSLTTPLIEQDSFEKKFYKIPVTGGEPREINDPDEYLTPPLQSQDGRYELFFKNVHIEDVKSTDLYPELNKSDAYVYHSLDYRHWDHWNDGSYSHVFYRDLNSGDSVDIMKGEPYYTPQAPFGGSEDVTWSPDGKFIYYVSKKVAGTEYALSTNTDIYQYNIQTGETKNVTASNKGYDTSPRFSEDGKLAYLQMQTPGYEADKNDIIVLDDGVKQNLTAQWDGTVSSYTWANNGKEIYFIAPVDGTKQLFRVDYPGKLRRMPFLDQLSEGQHDITGIVAETNGKLIVTLTTMNQAADLYSFDLKTKELARLTQVNEAIYEQIKLPKVERRMVTTVDGKDMLTWVIYPPDFDPKKKYPTLLYAQGGPQSPLSQFYSFRWNFQLMASQGYIIVAPNRRGMPGHGVEWNQAISKDWGGLAMQDYLYAIDDVAKEPYVDKERLGAVGASFGGYSVFWLAGHHEGRFKTFISHDGVFNTRSMYGTTEELFFVNYDIGGPYWEKNNKIAQKGYQEFNPINYVQNWDTPILIIQGGKDYRVPIGQGLEAFQAAQLQGIKSKLLFLPEENHWVLSPQNGLVWQREFFKWLEETLKLL
ncbi:S9 family peptidase [Membranicola marinus]|uniref:S9 family peptidase n=1 Tax=Membranihabitans marinus TaxID=1227546 RepID=A0A953HXQ9_9BACT|nr:S9 family peptidase [Membranihabitans marinus]MBY5960081.1 S9 family peptidase [Membranihabitans marinus]